MYKWPIWIIDSKIRHTLGPSMRRNITETELMFQLKGSSIWIFIAGLLRSDFKEIRSLKSKGEHFEVT